MDANGRTAGDTRRTRNFTVPNVLTALRGLAAIPIAAAVLTNRFGLALVLVFLAGVSDGVDGLVARRLNQSSDLGRLLDPIADKTLLVVTFVAVSLPGFGFEPLPWWLATLAIARDAGIVAAGYVIFRRTGFSGFTPTMLGKLNTVCELLVVGLFLLGRVIWLPGWVLQAAIATTSITIVVSGLHYVVHARRQLEAYRATSAAAELPG
ncbi:MAG TPA: CDP-alcohol phosphatidyltransferase family protein [Blastocatellia bacterium]|nr:CDP-alcohol phosphatidyltransferase family protein [Blastocatellia bacterium]